MRVVLDADAVAALADRRHDGHRHVRRTLDAASRLGRGVSIPTVTLAELYRGAARSRSLDAALAHDADAFQLRDTDRALARLVGSLLNEAGAGSEYLADAHAVAVAVEAGGGVVVTSDPDDLSRLAAPYRSVTIEPLH